MTHSVRSPWFYLFTLLLLVGITTEAVFANKKDTENLPLLELQTFAEVFDQIKKNYVEPVEDKKLLEHAVEGMLAGLDPHSAYLDPETFEDLQINTKGEFGGLGIEVTMEDGFVKVVAPIDDTPAQKAGLQPGDLIIKLDDTPVKGMSLRDAVNRMRGKVGSKLGLTILRQGEDAPFNVTIERAVIQVRSVKSELLEKDFGYVRISQFQMQTGRNLKEHINKLRDENDKPLKGIVLDLRNNPGGVLKAAVDVADLFLEGGMVVYTEGRIDNSHMEFKATPYDILKGAPVVVLVNGGSASASEIVAGALQDHQRAIIMGNKTFGKGSVQTVLPLKNERALKLTTALYYTPKGRSIQAEGIEPDLEVEPLRVSRNQEDNTAQGYKEADLKGHLSKGENDKSSAEGGKEAKEPELLKKDFQLREAFNLLKGLAILGEHQRA